MGFVDWLCNDKKTEKQPIWKDNILWVWSEYYGRYVANYSPSHYLELGNEVDLE